MVSLLDEVLFLNGRKLYLILSKDLIFKPYFELFLSGRVFDRCYYVFFHVLKRFRPLLFKLWQKNDRDHPCRLQLPDICSQQPGFWEWSFLQKIVSQRKKLRVFSGLMTRVSTRDQKDKGKKIKAKFITPKLSFLFCSTLWGWLSMVQSKWHSSPTFWQNTPGHFPFKSIVDSRQKLPRGSPLIWFCLHWATLIALNGK